MGQVAPGETKMNLSKKQAIKKAKALRARGENVKVYQIVRTYTMPFVGVTTDISYEVRKVITVSEVEI
jgi:hypothetical protein